MKKILYTLLAVSLIFSACEEDTPLPAPNNNNNSALAIGDTHQGGIIFYLDGNGRGFIVAPSDQSDNSDFGCWNDEIVENFGTAIGTGAQNTIYINEAECNDFSSRAADFCTNASIGGYNDWFLPSKDELNLMYQNVGQGNLLGLGNIGQFNSDGYWSSSQISALWAWKQDFTNGNRNTETKAGGLCVRAIRAF